jgi:hypothetical protein
MITVKKTFQDALTTTTTPAQLLIIATPHRVLAVPVVSVTDTNEEISALNSHADSFCNRFFTRISV